MHIRSRCLDSSMAPNRGHGGVLFQTSACLRSARSGRS